MTPIHVYDPATGAILWTASGTDRAWLTRQTPPGLAWIDAGPGESDATHQVRDGAVVRREPDTATP